jgi:hypothetical protein
VWLVGGVVRVLAAGRGVVGDSVCGADASVCGGRLIVACAVCSRYAALSDVPVRSALLAVCWGPAFEGRGMRVGLCSGCHEDARTRVGLCGAGDGG